VSVASTLENLRQIWRRDGKVIALVSTAHFVSHYHILLLPPVFALVMAEYGASYTDVALALIAFNVVSAALQTPAGFAVDRFGGRTILTAGLLIAVAAICIVAFVPSYWALIGAYALLGLANTVYHPADYSVLSATVEPKRIGTAFSIHTFAGYFGGAVAPAGMYWVTALWGWRAAFLAAAVLALLVAVLLMCCGGILTQRVKNAPRKTSEGSTSVGWRLLFSGPILRNLLFYVLLAMIGGGLTNYSVVALGALHGTPFGTANVALSAFLLLSAVGVLVGGFLADRTRRHERIAATGFAATTTMVVLIGWVDLPTVLLVLAMAAGGLMNGIIQPSRDMMVRAVTPPGAFGKVFGFVSTGFNIGGMIAPLLYAWLMDRGQPQMIFVLVAIFILLALLTVMTRPKPQPSPAALPQARPAE
jgi:FSR family fosmidomycin resistance protein-like MFS transporter